MFFTNPDHLESNLNSDLNDIIDKVKQRQHQHLSILQSINDVLNFEFDLNQFPETSHIKQQLKKTIASHQQLKAQQNDILEKYVCIGSSMPSIIKLIHKGIIKILEAFQLSKQKIQLSSISSLEQHEKMKNCLIKILQQKQKADIQFFLQTIILYTQNKVQGQILQLEKILDLIQAKKFDELLQMSIKHKNNLEKNYQQKKNHKIEEVKETFVKNQLSEKIRKRTNKVNLKIFGKTMYLQKQQSANESINPQEKKKKIYDQIMHKNKHNQEQILTFLQRKDDYEQKIKDFEAFLEKQGNIFQKFQQYDNDEASEEFENDLEFFPAEKSKLFKKKQKKSSLKRNSHRFAKQLMLATINSTQQHFQNFKFNMKKQKFFSKTKGKLPQISSKSALENRYEHRSIKKDSDSFTKVKNINIDFMGGAKMKSLDKDNRISNLKNRNLALRETYGLQCTFYTKKGKKFFDTQTNFI